MRSSTSKVNQGNSVQADRMWIRRVKQEEYNMIDSYTGPMKNQIEKVRETQGQNRFYPQSNKIGAPQTSAAAAFQMSRQQAQQPSET